MEPRKNEQILSMLRVAIEGLESPRLRSEVRSGLMTPICETRTFQTGRGDAQGDLWIFYVVPGQNVALAYSDEGYGLSGMPWGLVFYQDDQYGSLGSWYRSLRDLLADSSYFEVD